MSNLAPWTYRGVEVVRVPDEAYAFVYKLTDTETGRSYIGKKTLWSKKIKTLKGKRKRYLVESDWRTYCSSSKEIQAIVADNPTRFVREILCFAPSKGTANYYEAKTIFALECLEQQDIWYNGIVQCRVHHTHIKPLVDVSPEWVNGHD